ncbi:MAG: hypothetical protein KGI82_00605 [Betaproteobacteria bacterium]|nr:hypothetical protein [Betaproteobacteria bacterium]
MTTRTSIVTIGSLELTARADVTGRFRPARTQADPLDCYPAESPEVDVCELWTRPPAFSAVPRVDMLGLLDDAHIDESVQEQILAQLAEAEREGDPDAGDRARDAMAELP